MKRKLFTGIATVLLFAGLTMLIAPRISNHVGEQIAHTTIEDFKALKSKATSDEPTKKDESSEDSSASTKPRKNNAQNEYVNLNTVSIKAFFLTPKDTKSSTAA